MTFLFWMAVIMMPTLTIMAITLTVSEVHTKLKDRKGDKRDE